jgi:hypothetical protein
MGRHRRLRRDDVHDELQSAERSTRADARCEHCAPFGYDAGADPASFTNALRLYGEDYLRA